MNYLVTFHTHSGAIKYRKHLKKYGLNIKLKPVPRRVSSNCGVAGAIETNVNIMVHLLDCIERIYIEKENKFETIYISD